MKLKMTCYLEDNLPKQLELNKFLESLKRKVMDDYDIPISIKELVLNVRKALSLETF